MAVAEQGDGGQGSSGGHGKMGEQGKKFGKKLGNAAIFGAGATIGSNIKGLCFAHGLLGERESTSKDGPVRLAIGLLLGLRRLLLLGMGACHVVGSRIGWFIGDESWSFFWCVRGGRPWCRLLYFHLQHVNPWRR
ncbi:hypothetical protein VTK73DRAFT_6254 [Phialemonium thermophilum]|uniref:Uncharacterized protein n=1 Tax=Phialemonium thermophilum TaxID=223376 RepID=A0ABR3UZT8_9PEZI